MPAFVKTKEDEHRWTRAKSIVRRQYPHVSESSDSFWRLTTGIYKKMNLGVDKKASSGRVLLSDKQRAAIVKVAGVGQIVGDIGGGAIGGVAGAGVGAAVGAAIGTAILPGAGTAAGMTIGKIVGGIGGGMVGGSIGGKVGGVFDKKQPEQQIQDMKETEQAMLEKASSARYTAVACYNMRKQANVGALIGGAAKLAPKLIGGAAKLAPKAGALAGKAIATGARTVGTVAGKAGSMMGRATTAMKPVMNNVVGGAKRVGSRMANTFKNELGRNFAGGVGGFAKDVAKEAAVGGLVTAGVAGAGALANRLGNNQQRAQQQQPQQMQQPQQQQIQQ